jgi:hypothetical protein
MLLPSPGIFSDAMMNFQAAGNGVSEMRIVGSRLGAGGV